MAQNKPVKRIAVVDSQKDFVKDVLRFVESRYDFIFTQEENADYVFHSIDGYDVLKYSGVRIFVSGENVTPNFAISDYAMTFERLSFSDRYIWLPLIKLYQDDYSVLTKPRVAPESVIQNKTDFCAYVMSNTSNSAKERELIFDLLSDYKKVNSGGLWKNNVGGRVPDKLSFQSKHKFVIAFENYSYSGYLTEKFSQAAVANAIPIYWGTPDIEKIFNPKAFINCHNFQFLEDVIEKVKEIDQDDNLYRQMLAEPWFVNAEEPKALKDETFVNFLTNIFDQPLAKAYRRNRSRWGIKKEQEFYDMYHRPHVQAFRQFRKKWRRFWHLFLPRRKKY